MTNDEWRMTRRPFSLKSNEKEFRHFFGDRSGLIYFCAGADGLRQGDRKMAERREANLKKETGWLTVAGLFG